jgi:hypothetical protein
MTEEEEIKKIEKTPEEKIAELLKKNSDLHEKFYEMLKKTYSLHEKIQNEIKDVKKETESLLAMVTKKFKEHSEIISKSVLVSETTEETLLNVLTAIRQNEYLQAWYPAQQGYPEMKVVGAHPSKQKNTQSSSR